jgi:hypothetical protein
MKRSCSSTVETCPWELSNSYAVVIAAIERDAMGRAALLWLLGVPIPVIILLAILF